MLNEIKDSGHAVVDEFNTKTQQPTNKIKAKSSYRVAIIHDYLNQQGGAEKVLDVLHDMFPHAPIYTSIVDYENLSVRLRNADIRTSFMQRLPGVLSRHRWYLPFYPLAFYLFNLKEFNLIISSSSAFAAGIRRGPDAKHIVYCYTPMRYFWGYNQLKTLRAKQILQAILFFGFRLWDKKISKTPCAYIAISHEVSTRIFDTYNRVAEVVYPPVTVPPQQEMGDDDTNEQNVSSFLVISRLVSYKRVDLAVRACEEIGLPLNIVGDGPELSYLKQLSNGTTKFLGRVSDLEVSKLLRQCRGVIVAGKEDFGLVPVEAHAFGKPVLAFGQGGAVETIVPKVNGILFYEQSVQSMIVALNEFNNMCWDPDAILQTAERFSEHNFRNSFFQLLNNVLENA